MAIHLLRDYQTQTAISNTSVDQIAYLLAIFCRRILGYTVVGQTNFDLDSSTYLKASGTTAGLRAGINFGSEYYYEVSIPVSVRTVSTTDIGRMLVLRSTANPRYNSGVFLITGVNTADNRYIIDWRSASAPPAEAADSMPWWLYERDSTIPSTRGANAGAGYRSNGASTCSRVILQSQHSSGWQVRICLESVNDWSTNNTVNQWTYAPGLGGDSAGDFPVRGDHTHSALWWDTASSNVAQMHGQGFASGTVQYRVTMIGDEEGHGVYCFVRRMGAGLTNWNFQFGICENEPTPLPLQVSRRLFSFGHNTPNGNAQAAPGLIANSFHYHGITQGFDGQPVSANIASWSFIETNAAFGSGPWYNSNASDHAFTQATELIPVDVVAGMAENWYNQGNNKIHQFEPRLMGRLPFLRAGRDNFPDYCLTSDANRSWQHVENDVFMMWEGPELLP